MKTVVTKAWLLGVLANNRAAHKKEHEEAFGKFREKAIEAMQTNLDAARQGKAIRLFIQLTQPMNQLAAYDRVIEMLEQSNEKQIELSEKDWQQYVKDQWEWTLQFKNSTSLYNGGAVEPEGY